MLRHGNRARPRRANPMMIQPTPKSDASKRHRWAFLLFGAFLIFCVCYFSWIPEPSFRTLQWMPAWLANWTDRNDNIRTAVPLGLLGVSCGWMLHMESAAARAWVLCLGGLSGLVAVVELGQLFLPHRHCDWRDVAWGILGAAAGMLPWWIARGVGRAARAAEEPEVLHK